MMCIHESIRDQTQEECRSFPPVIGPASTVVTPLISLLQSLICLNKTGIGPPQFHGGRTDVPMYRCAFMTISDPKKDRQRMLWLELNAT